MLETEFKNYLVPKIRDLINNYSRQHPPVVHTSKAYALGLELARYVRNDLLEVSGCTYDDQVFCVMCLMMLPEAFSSVYPPNSPEKDLLDKTEMFKTTQHPATKIRKMMVIAVNDYYKPMTIDGHHKAYGIRMLLHDIHKNAQEKDPAKYLKNLVNTESLLSLFANNSINRGSRRTGGLIDLQIKPNCYVIDKDRHGDNGEMIYSFCIFRRVKNNVDRKKDTLGVAISEVSPGKDNYYSLVHYFEQDRNNNAECFIDNFKEKMGIDFSPSKITYALLHFVNYIMYKDNLKMNKLSSPAPITEPKQLHDERDGLNVQPNESVEHESMHKSLSSFKYKPA